MTKTSFPLFPGLSARDALSLSTDGPISAAQWAEASAYDNAHPLQPGHAITRISSVTVKRSFGVKLLSWAMAQAIAMRGAVEQRDLENLGLTPRQIGDWKQEALGLVLASNPAFAGFAFEEAA